jgi:hypothetical protein
MCASGRQPGLQKKEHGGLTSHIFNRAGKAIHAFCHDFENAHQEVKDQMLIAAALWGRIEPQLLVLRRSVPSLGERYLHLQEEMLARLEVKLKDLVARAEKLLTMPSFQKYVVNRLPYVKICVHRRDLSVVSRERETKTTNISTQEVQICVVLEKHIAEICTGVRRLVQKMGPLLVLDRAPCSSRYRCRNSPTQIGKRRCRTVEDHGRPP